MADIDKLGRYEIIRVLGKGAMGVVYEGRDPNLDRQVAIKTIRVQNLSQQAALEYEGRFRTEARSVARLHHANIVSVFDSGQDGETAYLVMEFIQGDDLKYHLECGARISIRSAIVIIHDLLMALDHAHRQNVVHRDIKPANMLVEVSGRIKLTDFGVARIQEPDESNLTQVGGAVGTPKYMSPEQAKGQRGDSRSDIFSTAVVLYELLTGKLPFDGDNQFVIIHQIVSHDAAPPSTINSDVPAPLDEVIARAMAKNPDERYATAREFALALRAVAQTLPDVTGSSETDVAAEIARSGGQGGAVIVSVAALRDGSSTGIFGPDADASLASTVSHDAELGAWNAIKDSEQASDYEEFLRRFPAGIYARRAQQRLEQNGQEPKASGPDLGATMAYLAPESPPEPASAVLLPAPFKGKNRLVFAALGAVCAAVALFLVFKPSAPNDPLRDVQAMAVAPPLEAAAPVLAASAPAASPAAAAIPAVAAASRPTVPRPAAALAAASAAAAALLQSKLAKPKSDSAQNEDVQAVPKEVLAPAASPPVAGAGPSEAGQVCAEKVFVFRIACVAEQCKLDRYRQTPECLQFKEMERIREEERNNRR